MLDTKSVSKPFENRHRDDTSSSLMANFPVCFAGRSDNDRAASFNTFQRTWNAYYPEVKTPATKRFSKCDICCKMDKLREEEVCMRTKSGRFHNFCRGSRWLRGLSKSRSKRYNRWRISTLDTLSTLRRSGRRQRRPVTSHATTVTSFTFRCGLSFLPSASYNAVIDCRWLDVPRVHILISLSPRACPSRRSRFFQALPPSP